MSETKQKMKPVRSFQISRRRMLRASALSIPMLLAIAGKAPGQFAGNASAASMLNGSIVNGELVPSPDGAADGQNRLYAVFHNVLGDGCRCEDTLFRGGYGLAWDDSGYILYKPTIVIDETTGLISSTSGTGFYDTVIHYTYTVKKLKEGSTTEYDTYNGLFDVKVRLRVDGHWIVIDQTHTTKATGVTTISNPYQTTSLDLSSVSQVIGVEAFKTCLTLETGYSCDSVVITYTPPANSLIADTTQLTFIASPYGSQL